MKERALLTSHKRFSLVFNILQHDICTIYWVERSCSMTLLSNRNNIIDSCFFTFTKQTTTILFCVLLYSKTKFKVINTNLCFRVTDHVIQIMRRLWIVTIKTKHYLISVRINLRVFSILN